MVDALREALRVLVRGGIVLDMRPVSATYRIEAVTTAGATPVGELDAYGAAEDDRAADAAVQHGVFSGWFFPGGCVHFDFEFYWDTAAEMKAFAQTSRRMRANLCCEEWEKRRREAGGGARLRCHRPMILNVYRKSVS